MTSPAPYLGAVRRLARWLGTLAVDGPAGPAFRAKRGCFVLAQRTGAPIVPVSYRTRRNRTLEGRWDKMLWVSFFEP